MVNLHFKQTLLKEKASFGQGLNNYSVAISGRKQFMSQIYTILYKDSGIILGNQWIIRFVVVKKSCGATGISGA